MITRRGMFASLGVFLVNKDESKKTIEEIKWSHDAPNKEGIWLRHNLLVGHIFLHRTFRIHPEDIEILIDCPNSSMLKLGSKKLESDKWLWFGPLPDILKI